MPRSNVAFKQLTTPKHKIRYVDDADDENEAEIQLQSIESKFKTKLSRQKSHNIDVVIEDESDVIAIETFETIAMGEKSDSEFEDSIQEEIIIPKKRNVKTASSTVNSWNDLDFPEQKAELPRNYFSEGPTPWSNFQGRK